MARPAPSAPSRRELLVGAVALAACGTGEAPAPPPRPNVLLVTLCSARADRVGAYGYAARPTTPSLDALAARGARFTHAWANGTWTNAAHASLLTGLLPGHHRVEDQLDRLVPGAPTLPGALAAAGWRTAAALQEQGPMTLDAQADVLRDVGKVLDAPDVRGWSPEPLLAWIARDPAPFFALVTLREAHLPFGDGAAFGGPPLHPDVLAWRAALPRPGSGAAAVWTGDGDPNAWIAARAAADPAVRASLDLAYDAGLAAADASLGRLLAALEAAGRLADTLVIVVGDHGEALPGHKDRLDREVVRVPFVVAGPGVRAGAVAGNVAQVDVMPTVLAWTGLPAPKLQDGQSLAAALGGAAVAERGVVTQVFAHGATGVVAGGSLVRGAVRVMRPPGGAPSAEREGADGAVLPTPVDDAAPLLAELGRLTADTWLPAGPAAPIPAALRDGMRARGYW